MESSEQAESLSLKSDASPRETRLGEKDEHGVSSSRSLSVSSETARPPLPPRPTNIETQNEETVLTSDPPRIAPLASKQNLQSRATTALSLPDISSQINPDDSRETHSSTPEKAGTLHNAISRVSLSQTASRRGSEAGDTASIRSYVPGSAAAGDLESIFGDFPGLGHERAAWNSAAVDNFDSFDLSEFEDEDTDFDFSDEFESIGELDAEGHNEGMQATHVLNFDHSI